MYEDFLLDKVYFINVIKELNTYIEENRDYLSKLDSAIGDGDHGINMSIGFREVMSHIEEWEEKLEISALLNKVGMALLGKVGGSAGPLYGSFFMKMGMPVKGKTEINFNELYEMFKAGIEAIEARGKAVVGEKTMVDALRPGINALAEGIKIGKEPIEAFKAFDEAAKIGAESTIPLIATKGRAMRLGERAIGHLDPGAASTSMMIEIFYNNLKQYIK